MTGRSSIAFLREKSRPIPTMNKIKVKIVNMFMNHANWSAKIVGIANTLEKRPELVCEAVTKLVALLVAAAGVMEILPEEEVPPFIK